MSPADSWNPEQYQKFKKERDLPFYDLMDLIHPAPFDQVLDLGCGTGDLTRLLHEKFQVHRTLGIDNSPNMLQKTQAFESQSLSFELADLATFQAQERFDLIISNAAIHWCPNHPQIFKNIHQALVPGGQLCVQLPANHDYPTHTLLGGFSSVLTPQEYAQLLFSLGFQEQNVMLKVYGHVLESREQVVEWVKGTLLTSFKRDLSPDDYQNFLDDYKRRLFEILPDERPFFYPFKRIFLWARK